MEKIILAFQGTGKTTYCNSNSDCKDMDFKYYPHNDGWIREYVDELEQDTTHRYIFCNISDELMKELSDRGIKFTIFAPVSDNAEYEDVKALLVGRCVIRKTQTAHNVGWIERLKRHFDEWCDPEFFKLYKEYGTLIPMTLENNTISRLIKNFG